jgi:hypothetical protein
VAIEPSLFARKSFPESSTATRLRKVFFTTRNGPSSDEAWLEDFENCQEQDKSEEDKPEDLPGEAALSSTPPSEMNEL